MEVRTQRPSEADYLSIGAGYSEEAIPPDSSELEKLRLHNKCTVNSDRRWQKLHNTATPEQKIYSIFCTEIGCPNGLTTIEDGTKYREFMESNYSQDLLGILLNPSYDRHLPSIGDLIRKDSLTRVRRNITSPSPSLLKKMRVAIENELGGRSTRVKQDRIAFTIFSALGLIYERSGGYNSELRINPDPVYGLFEPEFKKKRLDYPKDFRWSFCEL